jgi:hypothetical protein
MIDCIAGANLSHGLLKFHLKWDSLRGDPQFET